MNIFLVQSNEKYCLQELPGIKTAFINNNESKVLFG